MERLTKKNLAGTKYVAAIGGQGAWGKIMQRLAAYEDTGLDPEEIEELDNRIKTEKAATDMWCRKYYDLVADKLDTRFEFIEKLLGAVREGRVTISPVGQGDSVFYVSNTGKVCEAVADGPASYFHSTVYHEDGLPLLQNVFSIDELGKHWFLTEEDAANYRDLVTKRTYETRKVEKNDQADTDR